MLSAGQPVGYVDYEDFCFSTAVLRDTSSPSSGYEFPPMIFHESREETHPQDFTELVYTYLPSPLSTLCPANVPTSAEPEPLLRDPLCAIHAPIEDAQLSAQHKCLDDNPMSAIMWDWRMVPSAATTNSAS
jgi:hypothetical protein